MTVLVANPKGGASKTPTALLTAATFGYVRGGYTAAWDNNETRGTLGLRAEDAPHGHTVVDLLREVDRFLATAASVGELAGFLRPQSAHFDVLASDDTPGRMDQIDDVAFDKLRQVLSRFFRLIVLDTGNNVRAANWRAAMAAADCLVVPTTVQHDVADSGLWMLDGLRHIGREDLTTNAVAVVSCADPHPDRALLAQIVERYRREVREVVVVPFDPLIRAGGRISYEALTEPSRRAWLQVCAAIADSLSARDRAHSHGGRTE